MRLKSPATKRRTHDGSRPAQRGFVVVVVMLFLIATVIFSLALMLKISSNNVVDGDRQNDSTAAFFLAESGLENAQAAISTALGGSFTSASCEGIGKTYSLARGSITVAASATPPTCGASNPCTICSVKSIGTVGAATRNLAQDVGLATSNGAFCATGNCGNNPVTWKLKLKNDKAAAGIGIFALSYDGQGNNKATCAAASNCQLQASLTSPSSGHGSVGFQGNAVPIAAGSTLPIYQTMSKGTENLAEVGALFFGNTAAPTLAGVSSTPGAASYWQSDKNATATTVGTGGSTTASGGTNDGTFTSSGTCTQPTNPPPNSTNQACSSWCYGGDTLVYGFSGNASAVTDRISAVIFGTNSGTGQNQALIQIAKYPPFSPAIIGAPTNVDAEIWYAYNPNFTPASAPLALGASSYKGNGTANIGAQWTTTTNSGSPINTGISGTTLTVGTSDFTSANGQIINPGDIVTWTGSGAGTATISGYISGTGGSGTYTVSPSVTVAAAKNRVWKITSKILHVTACTVCFFANGDLLTNSGVGSGQSINLPQLSLSNAYGVTETPGGAGRYPISSATYAAQGSVYAGTPGTTVYLPASSSQPTVTTPPMLIAVKSGIAGALAPGTTVTAVNGSPANSTATTSFTISNAPTTALNGASLCGGTCAFFVPGGTTNFSLTFSSANMSGWASAFTCLVGVAPTTLSVVTSTSTAAQRWTEPVQ